MPLYMTQFSNTPEAWAALTRNPEDRSQAVSRLAEQLGTRLVSFYYSFGDYDGVVITEAPDDVTAAAAVLASVSAGHIKAVKTVPLLTVDQAMEAMRKAGGATFRAPGQSGD
jgi:uncharacterized protein with GYD domain